MGLITQNKPTYENIFIYLVYFPICLHCFSIIRKKKLHLPKCFRLNQSFFATSHKLVYGLQMGSRKKKMTEGNFSSIRLHIENKQKSLKEYADGRGGRAVKEFTVATSNVSLNKGNGTFLNNHFT